MRQGQPERAGWMGQLRYMLAVNWARAEERVRARRAAEAARADAIAAGRKGGETAGAALPRPAAARPVPQRSGSASVEETRKETAARSGAGAIARRTFQEFGADNGTLMAAALSYYIMLSLVPIVLVGIAILGMVMGSNTAAQANVVGFLTNFMPMQREMIVSAAQGAIQARGALGGVGLIGLVLTASSGFETLETAINIAWNTPKRGFIKSKLFAFGMMLLVGALVVLTVGLTAVANLANTLPVLGWLGMHDAVRWLIGHLLPVLISMAMFTLIYKLFPNVEGSTWRPSITAGVITGLLFELFKQAYQVLAPRYIHQDVTYGTLAGFVGLIVWIYYSSAVVLLGSELAWVLEGCPGDQSGTCPVQPPTARGAKPENRSLGGER